MRRLFGLITLILLVACLAGCGKQAGSAGGGTQQAAAEESRAEETAADAGKADTAAEAAAETAAADAGETGADSEIAAADAGGSEAAAETAAADAGESGTAAETAAETKASQAEIVVKKHKQEGTHMVTAGDRTISVPTTFEGLEMEGAEFEGEELIVKAGSTGTCRVKYKGDYNNIRISVKNNQDYDMAVRDCTIKGIEIASQEPDPELTLYGIPMGATRQQIADVYGEPFSKTFDDENGMSNMVYQFGTDIYSEQVVMIIFKDKRAVAASYDDFSLIVK